MNLGKFSMLNIIKKRNPHWKRYLSIMLGFTLVVVVVLIQWIDRRKDMIEMNEPIIVEFPLRGEWLSPNTPGTKIPSHGTNQLGTRYAYDFIQVDWDRKGLPAYSVSFSQYLISGVSLNDYYCYSQEVYAPCDELLFKQRTVIKKMLEQTYFQILLTHIKMLTTSTLKKMMFSLLQVTISSYNTVIMFMLPYAIFKRILFKFPLDKILKKEILLVE